MRTAAGQFYPYIDSEVGLQTVAGQETGKIIYDSNPIFSRLNLYEAPNQIQPTIERFGTVTTKDRVG